MSIEFAGRTFHPQGGGYYRLAQANAYLHREIYAALHGPIPKRYDIHHIDGDKENNSISNLACIPSSVHRAMHQIEEWQTNRHHKMKYYASDAGIAAAIHSAVMSWEIRKPLNKECCFCHETFHPMHPYAMYCSSKCKKAFYRKARK